MGEGDTGPNTGGMGSYSPAPVLTPEIEAQARGGGETRADSAAGAVVAARRGCCTHRACPIPSRPALPAPQAMRDLILPTARGMCAEGTPFRGVLFAGLMIKDGQVGGGRGGRLGMPD